MAMTPPCKRQRHIPASFPNSFRVLPAELVDHIFSFLTPDLTQPARVCRRFRSICEVRAELNFKAHYGTNKPKAMSWCHALKLVARCGDNNTIHHSALFYGLSHAHLLPKIDFSAWTDKSRALLFDTLTLHGLHDTITSYVSFLIQNAMVGQEVLYAIIRADNESAFDAIEAALEINTACLMPCKLDFCRFHDIPEKKLLQRLRASQAFQIPIKWRQHD